MVSAPVSRPHPLHFSDYREYLQAMIAYCKETDKKFSFRYFSRKAGFKSPNFLKMVADGLRELSPPSISKFAKAFELDVSEHEAFEALVLWNRADSDEDRHRYRARLDRLEEAQGAAATLEAAQYAVYSSWYAVPIRELMLQPDFREDPVWIAKRLGSRVYPSDIRKALELLERVGLAERDGEGELRAVDPTVATLPTVPKRAARAYHRAMLKFSADSLDALTIDKRNVSSLTVTLTPSQYASVCQRIEEFRTDLLGMLEGEKVGREGQVHHIGFQVVPLTQDVVDDDS